MVDTWSLLKICLTEMSSSTINNFIWIFEHNPRPRISSGFLIVFNRVAESLILGTMMVGQATAFAPNYNKAVIAAARIFKLLDRVPLINDGGHYGSRPVRNR